MSRLDHHINAVRNRLTLDAFVSAWAQTLLEAAAVVLAYVVVRKFTPWHLPSEAAFGLGLLGVTVTVALVLALRRRPDALFAATAIDQRLNLHEKFSTALHARRMDDAFSKAAVMDAEQTAQSADVRGQFKLHWPRSAVPAMVIALVAAGAFWLVPAHDLFAKSNDPAKLVPPADMKAREQSKQAIQKAIATIEQTPKAVADQDAVRLAKAELQELLKKPDLDPAAGHRKALSAQQELKKATDQALATQKFADAKRSEQLMAKLQPESGETGAVADAQRALAKGNIDESIQKLEDVVAKFDAMSDAQKQQAAGQMAKMAQQLQQMANDPKAKEKTQKQLQQLGLNPQQAAQAQKLLQQSAQGNPQAAQQLQQMAQQAMKQMNNGQGPTPQQMQQAQQMMQQMQAQANGQQQAQQLQQAAAQMAQAMKQAAGQNPQQANSAKQGQSPQQQQAQQGQQANAGAKPGQQQSQQQMQQAMQSMQQQMQQMQAAAQDAQQVAAAQQNAQQGAADAQAAMNGQGQGQGDPADGEGKGGQAPPPQANAGRGGKAGKGHTASHAAGGTDSPFTVDKQTAHSDTADNGRLLAASLIKSDAPKGESKAQLQNAARAAEQEAADEVDTERVGKQAQGVVRDYFGTMAGQ